MLLNLGFLSATKMDTCNTGAGYPQSETVKYLLNASAIPKDDDDEARDAFTGEVTHCQTMNPGVTQAIRVVK
jgi:hypothetical protein